MRRIKTLSFITAGFGLFFNPILEAKEKVEVYKIFRQKISGLEQKIAQEKDINKRYWAFLDSYQDLRKLRKANPRQTEVEEISMGLFFDTFGDLPVKKDFKKEKCPEYKKQSRTMMRSHDPENPEDPLVVRGLKIIEAICR